MQLQLMFQGIVADELFDRIDADVILDLVAVAAVFTGRRADPAHNGRKGIGIGYTAECVFLPGHISEGLFNAPRNVQPAADILTRRTAALARRRAMNVRRTFVGGIVDEDFFLPGQRCMVAILVPALGEKFFVHRFLFLRISLRLAFK
jgi:hypothetical protein